MSAALSDDEIEDRFFVLGSQSIIATLGQFIYKSIPVTVLFNNGKDFILTTLLEARAEALIFDLGGDPQANNMLLQAASCTFVTSINGIRVQFTTPGTVRKIWWDDAEAFAVGMPRRVLRLQRREAYRIAMPVVKFVPVRLEFNQDGIHQDKQFPIHDLSVSGLGIALPQSVNREPGQVIERLSFTLPERREIECEGVVCHVTELSDGSHSGACRMGITFRNQSRSMEIVIQRFIISLEHARRELAVASG